MAKKINWDALGISTSVACAIHCAILPLFFSSLPLFGVNIIDNYYFEYVMIIVALIVGSISLYHGYLKHHHSFLPFSLFIIGIAFLLAKQLWHHYQLYLLIPAVISIVTAHYTNFKLCRQHNHAHKEDCNH
jgi:MerC mercury resistance protein